MIRYGLTKWRGATEAEWQARNPIVRLKTLAVSTDIDDAKVGDGVTRWADLPYIGGGGGGGGDDGESAPARTVVTKTTTYAAVSGDLILADATAGAFTISLPAAALGAVVTVKKISNDGNAVTVSPASGTIDGAATLVIIVQQVSREVWSDGTNWWIV